MLPFVHLLFDLDSIAVRTNKFGGLRPYVQRLRSFGAKKCNLLVSKLTDGQV